MKEIYLAGGCFWGMEAYFDKIFGVIATDVGYANGYTEKTNYDIVDTTGHAETIHVTYDEKSMSLRDILLYYLRVVDPTALNHQGNDYGKQYRTGVFYVEKEDEEEIRKFFAEKQKNYKKKNSSGNRTAEKLYFGGGISSEIPGQKSRRILSY